jgi:hypothetical protein
MLPCLAASVRVLVALLSENGERRVEDELVAGGVALATPPVSRRLVPATLLWSGRCSVSLTTVMRRLAYR